MWLWSQAGERERREGFTKFELRVRLGFHTVCPDWLVGKDRHHMIGGGKEGRGARSTYVPYNTYI